MLGDHQSVAEELEGRSTEWVAVVLGDRYPLVAEELEGRLTKWVVEELGDRCQLVVEELGDQRKLIHPPGAVL